MTLPAPRLVSYKEKRGFVARGVEPITLDLFDASLHAHRCAWLAAQLEGASRGTCQSYDGAGFSIGLLHTVAVFPATLEQGPAWKLLEAIPTDVCAPALRLVDDAGWKLSDGRAVDAGGRRIGGEAIRAEVAGPKGVTPPSGPQHERAKRWIVALREVLADARSFPAQRETAIAWLAIGHRAHEASAYTGARPFLFEKLPASAIVPALDLAMVVYHAFSVNAPSLARKHLLAALPLSYDPPAFARKLTTLFATSTYGNWRARYKSALAACKRSGLWDAATIGKLAAVSK